MVETEQIQHTELLTRETLRDRLTALPRYSELSSASRERLVALGISRLCRANDHLFRQGETSGSLFILLSGRIKMVRSLSNGRSVMLALFSAGDAIGVSLLGGRPSEANFIALESSLLLEIPSSKLLAATQDMPQLLVDLLPILTEKVAECRNCVIEGTFYRIEPRLARLFLKLAETVGRTEQATTFIPVPLSRQDLADMAGTTIETSIRIMSRWGKAGIVETRADGFVLHNRQALSKTCNG